MLTDSQCIKELSSLFEKNQFDNAIRCCKQWYQKPQKDINVIKYVSNNLYQANKLDEAHDLVVSLLDKVIRKEELYIELGRIACKKGLTIESKEYFFKALSVTQRPSRIYTLLFLATKQQDPVQALEFFKKAYTSAPLDWPILLEGASLFILFNEKEYSIKLAREVIKKCPTHWKPYFIIGEYYRLNNKEFRCIEYLEKALERIQDKKSNLYKDMLCDIVMSYPVSAKVDKKFNTFLNAALRILPKEKNLIRQKISNFFSLGEEQQAIDLFRKLTTTSEYNENEKNIIRADNVMTTLYSEYMSVNECFENHKAVAQYYSKTNNYEYSHSFHRFKDMNSLRVGFVSPDFSAHSVSYFLISFLSALSKEKDIEIYLYMIGDGQDKVSAQIKKNSLRWKVCTKHSPKELAREIYQDKIGVVVDLAGYTANNKVLTYIYKPAPIAINYLGYPFTTGLSCIDYRIVDNYTDPLATNEYATETLIRPNPCFLCYTPSVSAEKPKKLPSLHKEGFCFSCFNNIRKITENQVKRYASILKQVPKSKMIFKDKAFSNESFVRSFRRRFEKEGVLPKQIQCLLQTPTKREHYRHYHSVDLALDTYPYSGTTTTLEAMWMGVPTLTYAGESHHSRVSYSIMKNLNLDRFIVETSDEYIERAIELSKDKAYLDGIRMQCRERMLYSPICDAHTFSKNMRDSFYSLFQEWICKDKAAREKG